MPFFITFITKRMRSIFLVVFFLVLFSFSQEEKEENNVYKVVDSLFREDQFYISISYNLVQNRPKAFKQYSFSPGITAGFLRDMPFTKDRKWAAALGFGYSYNNIKQFVNSSDIFDDAFFVENIRTTIITHGVEFPLELRWRNATPTNHKFWRIYSGFKATYVFNSTLQFESKVIGNDKENINNQINRWQYGVYLTTGFNTWNFYGYYGLNPLYKDERSGMTYLNLGFMFYIL